MVNRPLSAVSGCSDSELSKNNKIRISHCMVATYAYVLIVLCPAQSVDLVHYPRTTAPATGSVTECAQCAENAHTQAGSSLTVTCSSTGSWTGQTPVCECDTGYEAATVSGVQICQGQYSKRFYNIM